MAPSSAASLAPGRQRRGVTRLVTGGAVVAAAYAVFAGLTWYRYGRPHPPSPEERDHLLDQFMPIYDIVERHHVSVAAPAALTLAAASELSLDTLPAVRAIIRMRELVLGASGRRNSGRRGLLAEVRALGWGVLAEVPGREVVVGAVTRPWEPDVTFRAVSPAQFAGFDEPGYVKIAWTIRADETAADVSVFRTETRAVATDAWARKRFRRYWCAFSPGIVVIRWALLRPLKREAERRAHDHRTRRPQ